MRKNEKSESIKRSGEKASLRNFKPHQVSVNCIGGEDAKFPINYRVGCRKGMSSKAATARLPGEQLRPNVSPTDFNGYGLVKGRRYKIPAKQYQHQPGPDIMQAPDNKITGLSRHLQQVQFNIFMEPSCNIEFEFPLL